MLAAGIMLGCSSDERLATGATSSVSFALGGLLSASNSVRICGLRAPAARAPFACASALPDSPCSCFNFDSDGGIIDPNADGGILGPAVVSGLCPSTATPIGEWRFRYEIFADRNCQGAMLNAPTDGGTPALACYDARDLLSKQHPNESVEALAPGPNNNHVLCVSPGTAEKTWQFSSCGLLWTPAGEDIRFDCGCEPASGGGCDCGDGGIVMADLEVGCQFEASSCDIVCPPAP